MPYSPAYLTEASVQAFLEAETAAQLTDASASPTYDAAKSLEIIERAESYIHGFIAHRYPVPITSATWVAVLKPHADILWRWFAQQARLVASFDPDGLRETIEFLKQIRDGKIDLAGVTPVDLITDASPSRFRSHEVVYTEPYVRGA